MKDQRTSYLVSRSHCPVSGTSGRTEYTSSQEEGETIAKGLSVGPAGTNRVVMVQTPVNEAGTRTVVAIYLNGKSL